MFVGGIDKEDVDLKKKFFKINFNEYVLRLEMKIFLFLVFIFRFFFFNTVYILSNKMIGLVRILQVMLVFFFSFFDSSGIILLFIIVILE